MKALVKREAKRGLWLEDVAEPEAGPNDVKIRVKRTAICGTDIHIYKWDEWAQKTISGADGRWSRVRRRDRRGWR
ncbi:MAG: alcohol dehydrogenase catalytic domain-containing protein [Hyphomonadaceae bacterium]